MSEDKRKHIAKAQDPLLKEDDDRGSSTGTGDLGGATGEVEFRWHDAMALPTRDDLLPPQEIKRLLIVHKDLHKERVDKQKSTREQRAAAKEGRYVAPSEAQVQRGLRGGGGGTSHYKKHPISDKAQFSGIDKQVVGVANLNEALTNDDLKEALQDRLENRLQNRPTNTFNPRPRFPG